MIIRNVSSITLITFATLPLNSLMNFSQSLMNFFLCFWIHLPSEIYIYTYIPYILSCSSAGSGNWWDGWIQAAKDKVGRQCD